MVGVYDYDDYHYCRNYEKNNLTMYDQSYIMKNKVRSEIMKNLKCVKDVIIIPVKINDNFLCSNEIDIVAYPDDLKTKKENGIIECVDINKIII